ncbi:MAG: hypothetical protein ACTSW1_07615 [Candidatus Hodarchaeales archaeon]
MNELCEGCHWSTARDITCGIYLFNLNTIDNQCPCTICLVKAMCLVKCEARYAYYYHTAALNKIKFTFNDYNKMKKLGGQNERIM